MKAIQLRFSRWFNRRAGRNGTLWESRYTSVIVEEEEQALRTMAAYIDLNPVRAGIVADPADYRWSGYAEAMAGKARSRRGLSEKVRANLTTPNERRLAAEVLTRRARHFTRGVIFGSRAVIDGWFEANRQAFKGRSRAGRKRGAKSLGQPALRGWYTLRDAK